MYFAVKFTETFWNICAGGVTLEPHDSVHDTKKNRTPRRCESTERREGSSPTWVPLVMVQQLRSTQEQDGMDECIWMVF